MKAFIVDKVTSFLHTTRIDTYHYTMFHGYCSRANPQDTVFRSAEDQNHSSLVLTINTYQSKEVIEPGLNLIFVGHVAQEMQQKFGLRFAPVIIGAAAYVEYTVGSMAHWETGTYRDYGGAPEAILLRKAAEAPVRWNGPQMMELLPYDGELLAETATEGKFEESVQLQRTHDQVQLIGTRSGLTEQGVLWCGGVHLFRQDVFAYLKPLLDEEFFVWQEINL